MNGQIAAPHSSGYGPLRQTRRATISSDNVRTGHAIGTLDPPRLTLRHLPPQSQIRSEEPNPQSFRIVSSGAIFQLPWAKWEPRGRASGI
jgi:hypothetical protein